MYMNSSRGNMYIDFQGGNVYEFWRGIVYLISVEGDFL